MKKITGFISALLIACSAAQAADRPAAGFKTDPSTTLGALAGPEAVLAGLRERIDALFGGLDSALAQTARELGRTGLTGPDACKALTGLCAAHPEIVDCAAVDLKGIMVTVEPAEYKNVTGADISSQEQIKELHSSKQPLMSKVFRSVEGFEAVDLEYPVFAPDGRLAGSVSALLRPELILSALIAPAVRGLPLEAWLMQQDGRILYDRDHQEIGRMLFTDPLYKPFPSLLEIGKRIAAEETGSGSYEFLGKGLKKPVKKKILWTSVGFHGTQWRLVLANLAQ